MSSTSPNIFLSKSDYAYAELKRLIVRGELAAGSKLDLDVLGRDLGVSRMPIRDALSRLQSQRLVEIHPQRATRVAPLSISDMFETYDARAALESLMAERAAAAVSPDDVLALRGEIERQSALADAGDTDGFVDSDRAFHLRLFAVADAPRTLGLLETLRDAAERYIHLYLADPRLQRMSIAEHVVIADLCEAGDGAAVSVAVRAHVLGGKEKLLVLLPPMLVEDGPAAEATN